MFKFWRREKQVRAAILGSFGNKGPFIPLLLELLLFPGQKAHSNKFNM